MVEDALTGVELEWVVMVEVGVVAEEKSALYSAEMVVELEPMWIAKNRGL